MIRLVHFLPSLDTGGAPINVMRVIKWHKKTMQKYNILYVLHLTT